MNRTQIYMTEEQKAAIAALSTHSGHSQSEIIRQAIDFYLDEHAEDKNAKKKAFLLKNAGAWKDDPDLTQDYVQGIRSTADSRAKRMWSGVSDHDQKPFIHKDEGDR